MLSRRYCRSIIPLVALVSLILTNDSARAQWGTLKGRVVVTGEVPDELPPLHAKGDSQVKEPICRAGDIPDESLIIDADSKALANVFVFLRRAPEEIHPDLAKPDPEEVVFDQKDCRFKPHAMVVRTDQTVLVKSDDPVLHNTHTSPTFNAPQNFAIAPEERDGIPLTFRRREPAPVSVTCDLHPWMRAWWLVVDHPYAAMTDEKGEFAIKNLPAGEHTFRVWHERAGWIDKSLKVDVPDGEATDIKIEVTSESLTDA